MRFSCFWYYSQCLNQSNKMDDKIWIVFTGCLCGVFISLWVNNIHHLLLLFFSVTSIFICNAERGNASSETFKALSKSIALPIFVEYDNNTPIIFLFTCKDIDWLSFLITKDFNLSLKLHSNFFYWQSTMLFSDKLLNNIHSRVSDRVLWIVHDQLWWELHRRLFKLPLEH